MMNGLPMEDWPKGVLYMEWSGMEILHEDFLDLCLCSWNPIVFVQIMYLIFDMDSEIEEIIFGWDFLCRAGWYVVFDLACK